MPAPSGPLRGEPPLDQPRTLDRPRTRRRGPQTLQAPTRPTAPPAPPRRPSASWVASAATRGTLAGWPMGCPGAGVRPCPALPTKAAPALVWGGSQMHLGVTWPARSPQEPGHGAGWTLSQTGSPRGSPRLGGPAARLSPRRPGPGVPCTPSAPAWSRTPGCDGPASSFSFVALTPLHQGTPHPPTPPLGYQTSWDQTLTWHNGTSAVHSDRGMSIAI